MYVPAKTIAICRSRVQVYNKPCPSIELASFTYICTPIYGFQPRPYHNSIIMTCATTSYMYVYLPKYMDDLLVLASFTSHQCVHPSSFKCFFVQGHFILSRNSSTRVRDLACSGSGVWVSFSRSATVQLFHSVTKTLLQEIDIEKAFFRIVLSKSCILNMIL